MPSFDITSKVDMQEVDNAVNQTAKEVGQRYDFKGTHNEVTFENDHILLLSADSYKHSAVIDILKGKIAKRSLSIKSLHFEKEENASGGAVRQKITIAQGISKEKGKEIVKIIKESKLKVQAQIMDDQVRVASKNIDNLQDVIQLLRSTEIDVELQFVNMRS